MPCGVSDAELRLDLLDGRLWDGEREVALTPKSFSMLAYFVSHPNRLISRQELLDRIWPTTHVSEGSVKDYVRQIRRALGDSSSTPAYIETVRGRGYRYVGDIAVTGSESPRRPEPAPIESAQSIAVLPFADMSDDADQAYFAAGIAADIVAELSRFRSLIVIARDSTSFYGDTQTTLDRVASDLDVRYILKGSVRRSAQKVRIHVQLIEIEGGASIWAKRYDRDLNDIFSVQDEVSRAIVSTLVGHIEEFGRRRAARKRPENLEVYDYLLLGDWHLRLGSREDVLMARNMFQRAIDLEPTNARAHAEMAFSYLTELWSDWTVAPQAAGDKAFLLARKAVELDRLDSRAHLYLAVAYHYGKSDLEAAEIEFDRAEDLNPNDYDAFCLRSFLFAYSGRAEQGVACAERAIRLSPLTTEDCRVAQCVASYSAHKYDEALRALQNIVDPANKVNAYLAMCFAQLGRGAEAKAAMVAFLAAARNEVADFPGTNSDGWRRYWTARNPFKDPRDFDHMFEGFRKAGLP